MITSLNLGYNSITLAKQNTCNHNNPINNGSKFMDKKSCQPSFGISPEVLAFLSYFGADYAAIVGGCSMTEFSVNALFRHHDIMKARRACLYRLEQQNPAFLKKIKTTTNALASYFDSVGDQKYAKLVRRAHKAYFEANPTVKVQTNETFKISDPQNAQGHIQSLQEDVKKTFLSMSDDAYDSVAFPFQKALIRMEERLQEIAAKNNLRGAHHSEIASKQSLQIVA